MCIFFKNYIAVFFCPGSLGVVHPISLPSWILIPICQCTQPGQSQRQQSLSHQALWPLALSQAISLLNQTRSQPTTPLNRKLDFLSFLPALED